MNRNRILSRLSITYLPLFFASFVPAGNRNLIFLFQINEKLSLCFLIYKSKRIFRIQRHCSACCFFTATSQRLFRRKLIRFSLLALLTLASWSNKILKMLAIITNLKLVISSSYERLMPQ